MPLRSFSTTLNLPVKTFNQKAGRLQTRKVRDRTYARPFISCSIKNMPTITCRFLPENPNNRIAAGEAIDILPGDLFIHTPMGLTAYLPTGLFWNIDQRASNCTKPEPHRCWRWLDKPPNVTVVQGDCENGAGSISSYYPDGKRYHAFLWHGELIDIEEAAENHDYWLTLSVDDRSRMRALTPPGKFPWAD